MRLFLIAALASMSLAACGPTPAQVAAAETPLTPTPSRCADDGPRFPVTGLCVGRISNYYDPEVLLPIRAMEAPAGKTCKWVFTETQMIDDALIYRALSCDGVTTNLEFSAGAHRAGLTYAKSALFTNPTPDFEIAKVFLADPRDAQSPLKERIAELPAAERAKCVISPANIQGWPKDALWITYNVEAAKSLPSGEVNSVCGDFGMDQDSQKFWLLRQGYAFSFDLGQEQSDIDPQSFLIFAKSADGTWTPKK